MKKDKVFVILYIISILFILGFCIQISVDYFQYTHYNSAPFYVYLLVRIFEFLIPSLIIFIFAKVIKKKYNR